jgi:hypothetical protein
MKDSARASAFHGSKLRPIPDPTEQDLNALAIAKEKLHARRLGKVPTGEGPSSAKRSWASFERAAFPAGIEIHLAEAAERAGLDLSELGNAIVTDFDR